MDCPEENVVVEFIRGELAPKQREVLERHLDGCPTCCRLIADLTRIFRSHMADDLPAVPDPEDELGATIGSGTGGGPPTRSVHPQRRVAPAFVQGDHLGRYVVLDRIGAGGMGVVYAAYDPELDRKVALKLLLGSPGGSDAKERADNRSRLMREAQAMAKLSHPHVITVHDVGTFGEQVFIAMEFIDGPTLTQWLVEDRHSWREVLAVFCAAGRGLAAAHAAGLVHRDFKPDNVLLGTDGRVVVTDFGLARSAVEHTDDLPTCGAVETGPVLSAQLTETGALVGTPAYMAPEQLDGGPSDALSDQFSFCVALYQGLYGERPFEGRALGELISNVSQGRIRPPAKDFTVPRWLRRAVRRGLQVQPRDRHPHMEALLAALSHDPFRRWRTWGAFALPFAGLAVGAAVYQQDRLSPATYCDDIEARVTGVWDRASKRELENAFLATEQPYASDTWQTIAQRLDAYAEAWVDHQHQACEAQMGATQPQAVLALRMDCLDRQLAQLATLLDVLGNGEAGTLERAVDAVGFLPAADECEDVHRLTQRLQARGTSDPEVYAELDALVIRARTLQTAARFDDAEATANEALEQAGRVGDRWTEAEALAVIAQSHDLQGRRAGAEGHYHEALTAALATGHHRVVAMVASGLIWTTGSSGHALESAERWARHGSAALESLGGDPELQAQLANAMAFAYLEHAEFDKAAVELRRSLEIREEAFGPDHPSVSSDLSHMGRLHATQGRYQEALALFERASALIETEYGPRHPNMAAALDNLGTVHAQLGKPEVARGLHERAMEIRDATLGPDHPDNGIAHHSLALSLKALGDHELASEHARRSLEIFEKAYGNDDPELTAPLGTMAAIRVEQRRFDDATEYYERALELALAALGEDHPNVIRLRSNLGVTLARGGDTERGLQLVEQSLVQREQKFGADHIDVARSLIALATVQFENRHVAASALAPAERAVKIFSTSDTDPAEVAAARFLLARILHASLQGDPTRSRALATEALRQFEAAGHPRVADVQRVRAFLKL